MRRYLTSTVRPMVDVDLAVHGLLAEAFQASGVRVDSAFPGTDRLPALVIGRAGGTQDFPPGAVDRPRIDLDGYAHKRQHAITVLTDALALLHSLQGRVVLMRDGTRFVLATVDEESGPITGQDPDTAVHRATASVIVVIHQLTPTPAQQIPAPLPAEVP